LALIADRHDDIVACVEHILDLELEVLPCSNRRRQYMRTPS